MKLRKYLIFLGLFLVNVYSAFAVSVQDAFTNLANVFSDFDIYEIYQIAPRFVDFIVVLVILLRVMKLPAVVKALGGEGMGKKTGTVIAVVMSFAIFTLPAQYGISTLAIGVLGLFLLATFITLAISSFIYGWFWNKGWTGKAFCITFSFLVFGATMHIFGGGDLNGLEEVSPLLADVVQFLYSLGLLSLIFVWPAIFGGNGSDESGGNSFWDKAFGPNNPIKRLFNGGDRDDCDDTTKRKPKTVPESDGVPDYTNLMSKLRKEVQAYEKAVGEKKLNKLFDIEKKAFDHYYDIINSEQFNKIKGIDYNTVAALMLNLIHSKSRAVKDHGVKVYENQE